MSAPQCQRADAESGGQTPGLTLWGLGTLRDCRFRARRAWLMLLLGGALLTAPVLAQAADGSGTNTTGDVQ